MYTNKFLVIFVGVFILYEFYFYNFFIFMLKFKRINFLNNKLYNLL